MRLYAWLGLLRQGLLQKNIGGEKGTCEKRGVCRLCLGRNTKGHLCLVLKCPHCAGHHNVQLCPQEEEEQALIVAGSEGQSEDEEAIRAWLDNKDWPGMNTLACKEDSEEASVNVKTLRETYEYERVLALTEPSTEFGNVAFRPSGRG